MLALSGKDAWFVEPLRWDQPEVPKCDVQWAKRKSQEPGPAYAARVHGMAGNLGIARGIKSNESKTRTKLRTWRVAGVPTAWGHECLIPELEAAGLSNIQLASRMARRPQFVLHCRQRTRS